MYPIILLDRTLILPNLLLIIPPIIPILLLELPNLLLSLLLHPPELLLILPLQELTDMLKFRLLLVILRSQIVILLGEVCDS